MNQYDIPRIQHLYVRSCDYDSPMVPEEQVGVGIMRHESRIKETLTMIKIWCHRIGHRTSHIKSRNARRVSFSSSTSTTIKMIVKEYQEMERGMAAYIFLV